MELQHPLELLLEDHLTQPDTPGEVWEYPPRTGAEQLEMASSHPVLTKSYILPTKPLRRAIDTSFQAIKQRRPNCGFVGLPRYGKTWAWRCLKEELRERMPQAFVVPLICEQMRSQSSTRFHNWVFECAGGHPDKKASETASLRAARQWATLALSRGSMQLVLLCDEFQRLTVDEMTYLSDLCNLVTEIGVRVTTIAFCTMEILYERDALVTCDRHDLVSRFLNNLELFEGFKSEADLRDLLESYDDPDVADYPKGSGWSFYRFFFPAAWRAGHRLTDSTRDLWTSFHAIAKDVRPGTRSEMRLGAEALTLAIEDAMVTHMNFDSPHNLLTPEAWKHSILSTGFRSSYSQGIRAPLITSANEAPAKSSRSKRG